jgi:hypothetical protein
VTGRDGAHSFDHVVSVMFETSFGCEDLALSRQTAHAVLLRAVPARAANPDWIGCRPQAVYLGDAWPGLR